MTMMHKDRVFSVATVATAEELAFKLTHSTYCLCNGFRLGDVLYLNDSFSEDGAQEYGVVLNGVQFESVTFSWASEAEALSIIKDCQRQAETRSFQFELEAKNKVESSRGHRCGHCA